jgi:translation initiation factor 2 subunit 2
MLPTYEEMLDELFRSLPDKRKASGERFEMPKVDVIIEGNKTIWRNFERISEILRRDKDFMAKYFSKELGAPVEIAGERLIIQRRVLPDLLQKKLEFFVKQYVLCWECKKIDTKIVTINGVKMLVCEACGARRAIA